MKKNNIEINQDESVIEEINQGLHQMENYSFFTPDEEWFTQFAKQELIKNKKDFRQDLLIFSFTALMIVSVVVFAILQNSFVFLAIQGLLTIILPFIAFYTNRNREIRS